jgi:hypothetical protein
MKDEEEDTGTRRRGDTGMWGQAKGTSDTTDFTPVESQLLPVLPPPRPKLKLHATKVGGIWEDLFTCQLR